MCPHNKEGMVQRKRTNQKRHKSKNDNVLVQQKGDGARQENQPKNVINSKMAPNNHEHTNSTHHVETDTPTLTNNSLQAKPTRGIHKGSAVEDIFEHTSWGKSYCSLLGFIWLWYVGGQTIS